MSRNTQSTAPDQQPLPMAERWLRIDEAALYTGYSAVSLRRFVKTGKLKCTRVTGRRSMCFLTSWLDDLINGCDNSVSKAKPNAPRRPRSSSPNLPRSIEEANPRLAVMIRREQAKRKQQGF